MLLASKQLHAFLTAVLPVVCASHLNNKFSNFELHEACQPVVDVVFVCQMLVFMLTTMARDHDHWS